jgi:hypothetical protein
VRAGLPFALGAALAAALVAAGPRSAGGVSSCSPGFSYVGVESATAVAGVSGSLTLLAPPTVVTGHVAAWLGIGGSALGPHGTDEWLQAGITQDPDGLDTLYDEVKRPMDAEAVSTPLGAVSANEPHRVAIVERRGEPGSWLVLVDGVRVAPPLVLPGSHAAFRAIATVESWNGGRPVCNRLAFDFRGLALARPGRRWQALRSAHVLRDPAYRLRLRSSGFTVSSR